MIEHSRMQMHVWYTWFIVHTMVHTMISIAHHAVLPSWHLIIVNPLAIFGFLTLMTLSLVDRQSSSKGMHMYSCVVMNSIVMVKLEWTIELFKGYSSLNYQSSRREQERIEEKKNNITCKNITILTRRTKLQDVEDWHWTWMIHQ